MKWSLKIGRILGIDVYIHATFLLLLGFVGVAHWLAGRSLEAGLTGVLFFGGMFLCVLLHEYGHALAARRFGIATRDITLLPIGGVARLERMPEKPSQELVVTIAGPLVNIVIAVGLFIGLHLSGQWQPLFSLTATSGNLVERLLAVNVFLVLFNLLPAFPMDGGRVLRSLLAMRMQYARATRIAARIGQGMAALFGVAGLFGNPMLLLIALFVWIGAAQEAAAVEMKSSFVGVRVREAMLTDFRSLLPNQPLSDAARLLLAGSQQDFPVMEDGEVVDVLSHTRLVEALRERGMDTQVGEVMERSFHATSADEALDAALARLEPDRATLLPVMWNRQLVGLLTAENVGEFYMIRRALSEGVGSAPPVPPVIRMPRVTPPPTLARQPGT
ncbi:MAG TPA: site-2 protease family protein [Verrucomicrobiae bacterium]